MNCPSLSDVVRCSSFVSRSLGAMYPGLSGEERLAKYCEMLGADWSRPAMEAALTAADTESLGYQLREMRRRLIMTLIGQNSTGAIDYFEVVRAMSDFAEIAVSRTVTLHAAELARRFGVPYGMSGQPQDLMVVGMGKLGGRELNVSSDIDLIFLYDEDGETRPTDEYPGSRTLSVHEFYERLARRIIPALNNIEGPGFVFRVDMRLRPNGDSGPIVCPTEMLEEYLYAQGRDWERFAWLKGRIINEPVFTDEAVFRQQKANVDSLVRPFVFRKYLDFSAISSLTKLHEMIRAETARREAARGDSCVNVKLGRGGIREIEFLTQTLQVIRGGRDPALRGRETLLMLDALADEGALAPEMAGELKKDYIFLRNVEHAIQYVNDEQTQRLPREGEGLAAVAGLMGEEPQTLWNQVQKVREYVAGAFDSVFHVGDPEQTADEWPVGWETGSSTVHAALCEKLASLGFEDRIDELVSRIVRLAADSRTGRSVSDAVRERMQKLIPMIVERCPRWQKSGSTRRVPMSEVLSRYLTLLEAIAGRSTYVSLLSQYPKAADRVGRVLCASRWSTDYIARHPIILDELVDGRQRELDDFSPVTWDGSERLHRMLAEADGDQERQLNILRDLHHGAIFQLMIADLDGRLTVERLADHVSALADSVIGEVLELAWSSLAHKHCERPKFAVIGYGKLGGKELGYDSDLDLVFIYDDPDQDADATYSRLVRRMISWLTIQTSSGKLFDIDLRLRPNGDSGLVVSSLNSFCRYQSNADGNGAWFWEHQALTRARFVAGDPDLGRRFEEERRSILTLPRTAEEARAKVLEMRAKMLDGHPNRSGLFDVKHDRGGMVDVEFVVQYFVLTAAREHPELLNNFGNILLLETASRLGLVPEAVTAPAVSAYRRYRAVQHEIRLNGGESVPVRVEPESMKTEQEAVRALWRTVFETDDPLRR